MNIPKDRLTLRFSRAPGPGGQNVNKVETKVEIRFVVGDADWIPASTRTRLLEVARDRILRTGELVISSSRFRSQSRNLDDCIEKLQRLLDTAGRRPKRRIPTRPTGASRQRRSEQKRARSVKKTRRRWRPDREG